MARVVKNELKRLDIIGLTGDKIIVADEPDESDVEASVEKGVQQAVEQPSVLSDIQFRMEYEVDDEVPVDDEQLVKALIVVNKIFGVKKLGRDIITKLRDEFGSFDVAKKIGAQLVQDGILKEVEDEDKEIDIGGEQEFGDEDYESAVRSAYGDLRRDISGGASPVMRPDDF